MEGIGIIHQDAHFFLYDEPLKPPGERVDDSLEAPAHVNFDAICKLVTLELTASAQQEKHKQSVSSRSTNLLPIANTHAHAASDAGSATEEGHADTAATTAPDSHKVLLVEGHTLLSNAPLVEMCTHVVYLDGSRDVCLTRRLTRKPRGVKEAVDITSYFSTIAWPAHTKSVPRAPAPVAHCMCDVTHAAGCHYTQLCLLCCWPSSPLT